MVVRSPRIALAALLIGGALGLAQTTGYADQKKKIDLNEDMAQLCKPEIDRCLSGCGPDLAPEARASCERECRDVTRYPLCGSPNNNVATVKSGARRMAPQPKAKAVKKSP